MAPKMPYEVEDALIQGLAPSGHLRWNGIFAAWVSPPGLDTLPGVGVFSEGALCPKVP